MSTKLDKHEPAEAAVDIRLLAQEIEKARILLKAGDLGGAVTTLRDAGTPSTRLSLKLGKAAGLIENRWL